MTFLLGLAAALAAVFLVWLIVVFNGLVGMRNRVRNGWAEIDVQLKRRHDLVPQLVETAKGYMQHERATFEAVTQARIQASAAGSNIIARSAAEASLTAALSQLLVRTENYPVLRAVENMKLLQEQLTSTENRIAFARRFYNDEVMKYNTALMTFPRNLCARPLGFSVCAQFSAEPSDRSPVQVKL